MYSDVVLNVEKDELEKILEQKKEEKGVHLDTDLTAEDLKDLVVKFKARVNELSDTTFPEDPFEQLWGGMDAVFGSWENKRARTYRRLNKIQDDWGTAVNVQTMVYGNMGNDCATGVAFTRDPATGDNIFFGEFLINAQGEDVVAGIRTPQPINISGKGDSGLPSLEEVMPDIYKELEGIYLKLEEHYKDMQDIEFTIQKSKLWMLQTRTGKRTIRSALKIAIDMVKEGLITEGEAVLRVEPNRLDQLLHPMIDPSVKRDVIAKGLPASPGAASGKVVFTADEAERLSEKEKVILVRVETSPEDIHGMNAAQGILTARGGMTSHAAVVARGMGKCCVAGCGDLKIKYDEETITVNGKTIKYGDVITIDGSSGEVMLGELPTIEPEISGDMATLMQWADSIRRLKVRANADTPHDAKVAREFGAQGIGLCRTEHMFFEGERIDAVREMILAEDVEGRKKALAKILPMQKSDFIGIFREMKGLPVTIRLLDPPLHEFIPHTDKEINTLAAKIGVDAEKLRSKAHSLKEFNPMLGHRGCRLGVVYPEIYDMQVQAIMEAACDLSREGFDIIPEIMIPLVGHVNELRVTRESAERVCKEVIEKSGVNIKYLIGTMIELPRASLTADEIGAIADFFSFGTNDLTQTTYGLSRDDAGTFLPKYIELGILKEDPFVVLDASGVGQLVEMGVKKGRSVKPDLKVGICGEHGGEPSSVEFCHKVGLDYVSCSPYRVPIARLAAAHAKLKE